ncbi:hypothetical protein LTR53_013186 [Teratosphaeriaceae sp. CCFEE 6253]|nr:hypothetical protein LTR53_013186 [Teratosphaeriaceae sp. CCFEE 6253]
MATAMLPAKRKRAQVSYFEQEADELDALLGVPDDSTAVDSDDSDSDLSFGSVKFAHAIENRRAAKKAKTSASVTSKPKKAGKPFPFLMLPPELRDYIYELALVDQADLTLVSKTKKYVASKSSQSQSQSTGGEPAHTELIPALLAVNKQIHAEGIGYLYQQPIVLEDTYALHSFLAALGGNRTQVTDLTVKGWGVSRGAHKAMNFSGLTLLSDCTNLKSLVLDCTIGWVRNPKGLARQVYRDGVYFLEAYGAANGAKDAAVDLLELSEKNFDGTQNWVHQRQVLIKKSDFKTQFEAELRKLLGCK